MRIERRQIALAAVATGLTLTSVVPAGADVSADTQAVAKNLEAFRAAQAAKDGEALASLVAPELSYSHSNARVENKEEFLKGATNPATRTLSLQYKDPTIRIVGDVAIVRFTWKSESETVADGKKSTTDLHILMMWQKQAGAWKLLSRASTKI